MLGYTSWQYLFILSVVFFYLQTCSCFYSVIFYLQVIMLLFSYLLFTVYLVIQLSFIYSYHAIIINTLIICISTFPFFLHTHWVAFWWSWICTSRLDNLFLLYRCSIRPYMLREDGVSLFLIIVILVHFHFCYFLIPSISLSIVIQSLY